IEARFIHENKGSALPHRFPPQLRPDRHAPVRNRFFITLDRSGDRNLRRPAQFLHQPGNVILVIGGTKLPLNHLGNASTGPNVPTKPISLRSVPEKLRHLFQLGRRQFRRTAGGGMAMQRLRSFCCRYRQPPADCSITDAKCCRNIDFQPAQLVQLEGSEPPPFSHSPIKMRILHPLIVTKVALFAQLSVSIFNQAFTIGSSSRMTAWARMQSSSPPHRS